MSGKKYNPKKDIKKGVGTMSAILVGSHVTYSIAGTTPHHQNMPNVPFRMMSKIPTLQIGSSMVRSMELFDTKKKRKKRK